MLKTHHRVVYSIDEPTDSLDYPGLRRHGTRAFRSLDLLPTSANRAGALCDRVRTIAMPNYSRGREGSTGGKTAHGPSILVMIPS